MTAVFNICNTTGQDSLLLFSHNKPAVMLAAAAAAAAVVIKVGTQDGVWI